MFLETVIKHNQFIAKNIYIHALDIYTTTQ